MAAPRQFQLKLDNLAAKASDSADVNLSGATLKFAAKFLDSHDPDEVAGRKLIEGLQGIYVKHFEFKRDNAWTEADLARVRNQLHTHERQRIAGVKETHGSEIYLHMEAPKSTGVAIIEAEPRKLTVINIVGPMDLDELAELGGHFDRPKLTAPKDQKSK